MSVAYEYEARIWAPGEGPDDGAPALTLGLSELTEVPAPGGVRVEPLEGRVTSVTYTVHATDRGDQITSEWGTDGRPNMLGRVVELRRRPEGGSWEVLDTGRIKRFAASEPGHYEFEITDEGWIAREARIWDRTDSLQLLPAGFVEDFGPEEALVEAAGDAEWAVLETDGDAVHLFVQGSPTQPGGALAEATRHDVVAVNDIDASTTNADGNFRNLQFQQTEDEDGNPASATLNVIVLSSSIDGTYPRHIVGSLYSLDNDDPQVRDAWVHWPGHPFGDVDPTPPAQAETIRGKLDFRGGEGIPVGEDFPKHVGGTEGVHLGRLVVDILEGEYGGPETRLEDGHRSDLLAADLPKVWLRQLESAERGEWLRRNVNEWRHLFPIPHPEDGVEVQQWGEPDVDDVTTLPLITATEATEIPTWENVGRDAISRVVATFRTLRLDQSDDPSVDGLETGELVTEVEGDGIGEREHTHEIDSELIMEGLAARGRVREAAQPLLDTYQDGPIKRRLRVESVGSAFRVGDLVRIDAAALAQPNPETGDYTGERLARVLEAIEHPDHYELRLLDFGPAFQPLDPLTVSVVSPEPGVVEVTVSGLSSGETAVVEATWAETDDEPDEDEWERAEVLSEDGTHRFVFDASGGYGHGRARRHNPTRVPSAWVTDSAAMDEQPTLTNASVSISRRTGDVTAQATPGPHTGGVRVDYERHAFDDEPDSLGQSEEFEASAFADGVVLALAARSGEKISWRMIPFEGWDSGSDEVTGDSGPEVSGQAIVPLIRRPRSGIEAVSALPDPGDEGRTVLLTADSKVYRDTGSEWTTEVDGEDLADVVVVPSGKDLQSGDFQAGDQGWRIRGNGDVEFSDGVFRGEVAAQRFTADFSDMYGTIRLLDSSEDPQLSVWAGSGTSFIESQQDLFISAQTTITLGALGVDIQVDGEMDAQGGLRLPDAEDWVT